MIPIARGAPGMIHHVADSALRANILAGFAGLLLWVLRVRQSSVRLTAWRGVLYAVLAIPLLGALLPPVQLRLPKLPLRPPAASPHSRSSAITAFVPTHSHSSRASP